jgi:diguanylate cyclase (GGDEF)-like protein
MDRDGLTGMVHRGALDRRLIQFGKHGGVIAVIDLDGFAAVNQEHGQAIGNQLLKAAAQTVIGTVRPDDVCARIGGDSFCVLLEGIETDDAAIAVAERIRSSLVRVHLEAGAPYIPLTASIGMTSVEPGGDGRAAVMRAESAVRRAKLDGGDTVVMVAGGDDELEDAGQGVLCPFTGVRYPQPPRG